MSSPEAPNNEALSGKGEADDGECYWKLSDLHSAVSVLLFLLLEK